MIKHRLFTPGPTPVPERVLLKMAEPILYHRSPEFGKIFERVNRNLKYLFQTRQPVLTLTCSGTGGIEAAVVSLFSPGDKMIAVNGGKFGERLVKLSRAFGLNVVEIKMEWGKALKPAQIKEALQAHPDAKAVYLTHSETSTGTVSDIKAISKVIRNNSSALICVDGISSIGAHEFRFDEWGVDVCVTGSQKGLMIPPGLAFVALSNRAIAAMKISCLPKFYFDLSGALKAYKRHDTPWTPAASLIVGADTALQMIRAEGIENVWKRHEHLAQAMRAGIEKMGLKLFSEEPSNALTAVRVPERIEWKRFNKILKTKFGVTIAGGQGEYVGKIFRISHLGYYDEFDIITAVAALEKALLAIGWKFEIGAGVKIVQDCFRDL